MAFVITLSTGRRNVGPQIATYEGSGHEYGVIIGEFAWSKLKRREGKYDWGWLDRSIDVA